MTREEAIFCEKSYIGETNCVDCKYYGTETCQSRESHKMAIKALEQEPKIEWIPVSERLPEKEDDYLVTDIDKEMHKVRFYFPLDGREPYFSGGYKIVAWMPLPKPYEAESEDKE